MHLACVTASPRRFATLRPHGPGMDTFVPSRRDCVNRAVEIINFLKLLSLQVGFYSETHEMLCFEKLESHERPQE